MRKSLFSDVEQAHGMSHQVATILTPYALFGRWWADSLAALGLLNWLVPEAREAVEGARVGQGAYTCGEDGCDD